MGRKETKPTSQLETTRAHLCSSKDPARPPPKKRACERTAEAHAVLCLGEGERVLALESREGTRASRRVEEGLSRSLSGQENSLSLFPLFPHLFAMK